MALPFATLKEGSEESRQKRAVRRYLNKKKQRPDPVDESTLDEGSEEARAAHAKRMKQKEKGKKEPVDESQIVIGSMNHMQHAVHNHHQGIEAPEYHIHKVGLGGAEHGANHHHYMLINKRSIQLQNGDYYHPSHRFSIHHNGAGYEVKHVGEV